ncbi:zinc finger protein 595-like [Trichoplusia ni]|uniref:Zinc finger protein 595-like n=1 Tax=Trichoplusia ni TaxID=7111 RepID=A0A7E5WUS3_TRINI|nr:zinc finger protein 595-like [Trichoplusia ni]
MQSKTDYTLPALKFITSESEHVCRLCFSSTDEQEVSLEDNVRLQRPYFDENVTFMDMFSDLSVQTEPFLPQVLCMDCATMTINSYLFQKLCNNSNENWHIALTKLSKSLDQSLTIGPSVQTAYLMIKDDENQIFTSRKRHTIRSKKTALNKVKEVLKAKQPCHQVKRRKSNVICEECGERFNSNCHLVKHMKVHSNAKYPCLECPKVFATQLQVEDHAERVHYPKKLQCPKCPKMFSTEKMLSYHDKLHHVAAVCKLCLAQFPSKKDLRAHLDKHDLNKCPRCSKSFLNKHTFKFHLKICGNAEERQPSFFCDICHKGYARKNGLRTHLKTDHGFGKVLSCNWCGKKFDAISRLNNHIVKHTKEKNFHCDQCGGKFVTQAALVYHTRLHTGERPFPCDLCNESFLSASRRMEHKRRKHFGPTKECHVCHMKFVTGHQLRKHVQRHYNPQSKLFVPEGRIQFDFMY